MARYLITGGAGFIGSHLCESFLKLGHDVICVDNYSTGTQENIASFASNPRFRFLDHNVSRFIDIGGSLKYFLHFSLPASPVDYLELRSEEQTSEIPSIRQLVFRLLLAK